MKQHTILAVALNIIAQVEASIVEDGLWTGNDWYDDDANWGVQNGVPYSEDELTHRRLTSPIALEGSVDDYMTYDNVQRVQSIISEDDWEYIFPMRLDLYTYEGFLHAVGKFPAFCGESNIEDYNFDLDQTCKRELAIMFAHFGQETGNHDPNHPTIEEYRQALVHITEWACTEPQWGAGTSSCDYAQSWGWAADEFPPQEGVQYFGRGPFQLSWNYNYGMFSEVLVESTYDSKMVLLENPDLVHTDAFTVFTSALWFYMTPQSPKPSMHDVASGFFVPTDADLAANIVNGLGATTNIINGGLECGQGVETAHSLHRIEYFIDFLDYFELPMEDADSMTCGDQASQYPAEGFGDAYAYFDQDWSGAAKCRPVTWQTAYSAYTRDDYKRCVCDWIGNGEEDCPQAEGTIIDEDTEEDQDNDDQVDIDDEDEETEVDEDGDDEQDYDYDEWFEDFEEIWDNPNYSEEHPSRTLYQVDRSIDLIEQKLIDIYTIFHANGMI